MQKNKNKLLPPLSAEVLRSSPAIVGLIASRVAIGQGKSGSPGKVRENFLTWKSQGYFPKPPGKPGKVREIILVREVFSTFYPKLIKISNM